MRSSEVSGVITSFPKKQAHSLECVRVSVSQLLPGAQECIAWGMPRIQKPQQSFSWQRCNIFWYGRRAG